MFISFSTLFVWRNRRRHSNWGNSWESKKLGEPLFVCLMFVQTSTTVQGHSESMAMNRLVISKGEGNISEVPHLPAWSPACMDSFSFLMLEVAWASIALMLLMALT